MTLNSLEDLFIHELLDLHSAEDQLSRALPKMAKAASSIHLVELLEAHLEETERQLDRLDTIFEELRESPAGADCPGMRGLIGEWEEIIHHRADPAVRDAALIAAAQRVEHYEIATYGSARTFAQQLGYTEIAELLQQSLDEEHAADDKLNNLALAEINAEAGG